jgi:very-short-patch-repair endonuclease
MLIECDGRQHDQLVPFYHGDKIGFRDSKKRDNRKEVLAGQQGYTLIRLTQKEILDSNSPEELLKIILHKITQSKRESEEEW